MSDEYEISDPLTIGGATGQYTARSPYNTECEWSIISVTGLGTLASAATFAIGSKNPAQPALSSTGADSFGKATNSDSNPLQSYVGSVTSTAPMITYGGDNYMPLPSPANVFATITTPATSELLITLQFRRKLDRPIPERPRNPATHSHVTGRRDHRTMMAGFAARYPEEGVPYEHHSLQPLTAGEEEERDILRPTNHRHRGTSHGRK